MIVKSERGQDCPQLFGVPTSVGISPAKRGEIKTPTKVGTPNQ